MTIVIGLLCQDGVVIGTDSSATFATARQTPTIEQKCKKIDLIDNHIILASTGQVGLGQRFSAVVEDYWKKQGASGFTAKGPINVCKELCALTIQDFRSTNVGPGQYGGLMAFVANDKFNLCEFAVNDFQPELKTESLWYVAMGSGQSIADPFLGLMRRIFWHDTPPTLTEGIFAALWALYHTIELNPGGINGPARIAVLERMGTSFRSRNLDEAEIIEHYDSVIGAEKHLEEYKGTLQGKNSHSKKIPEPPTEA